MASLTSLPRLEATASSRRQLSRAASAPPGHDPGFTKRVKKDRIGSPGPRKPLRRVDLRVANDEYVPFPRLAFPKLEASAPKGAVAVKEVQNIWGVALVDDEQPVGKAERDAPKILDRKVTELHLSEKQALRIAQLEQLFRTKKKKTVKGRLKQNMRAYEFENKKLRKAIRGGRGGSKKRVPKGQVRSHAIDALLDLERQQVTAAIRIQKFYKSYRRKCLWLEYVAKSRSALKIQKAARGMIVRKMLRLWLARRWYLISQVQGMVRGIQDRARCRRMFAYEGWAAVDIQRCWRGHLARHRVRRRIAKRAARKIQALWRASKVRAELDLKWLDTQVTKIQSGVLRFLAHKDFQDEWPKANKACVLIQRMFRGSSARVRRNAQLWERERDARQMQMRILRGEEAHLTFEIHQMRKKRKKDDLDGKLPPLRKAWIDGIEEVRKFEYDLVGLQRERMKMSPRAVEQGWTEALDKNVEQHRVWTTDAKLKALFQVALPLRLMEEEKEKSDQQYNDAKERREMLDLWWRQERDDMWARDSEHKWALYHENRKKNIAAQRRKWEVQYYTETGKPDLTRPSGRPWSAYKSESEPEPGATIPGVPGITGPTHFRGVGVGGAQPGASIRPGDAVAVSGESGNGESADSGAGVGTREVMAMPGEVGAVAAAKAAAAAALKIGKTASDAPMYPVDEEGQRLGKRVNELTEKLAAQGAVAQFVQYGALARPIIETMEKVQRTVLVANSAMQSAQQEQAAKSAVEAQVAAQEAQAAEAEAASGSMADADASKPSSRGSSRGSARRSARKTPRQSPKKVKQPLTKIQLERRADAIRRSRIPWTMLDELEVEKRKLAFEKAKKLPFQKKRFEGPNLIPTDLQYSKDLPDIVDGPR